MEWKMEESAFIAKPSFRKIGMGLGALILLSGLLVVVSTRLVTGRWLGFRSLARTVVSVMRAVSDNQTVSSYNRGRFTNIIFLHHSTGNNLIEQGGVREKFSQAGYDFWDHGYNYQGLRGPTGRYTGYSYSVPNDNTDPDGLARIFAQRIFDLPLNTLSGLLQHEVIIFKSCFAPANNITTDQQLEQYKSWYLGLRNVMDQHPDKVFIVVTDPPLNPAETNFQEAARARAFADWLKSDAYLSGHPNVLAFDLFNYLAEDQPTSPDYNMLREAYREDADSHPNRIANETVGSLFVTFVIDGVQKYRTFYKSTSSNSIVSRLDSSR
jgi:hypothetical protein